MKPYYQRDLSDFPDEVIVSVRESNERNGLWYAVLNRPDNIHGRGMPDFSTCGTTREDAIQRCATTIRNDAIGIGKYAPHSCFKGYDLHWILCAHWARQMGEEVDSRLSLSDK